MDILNIANTIKKMPVNEISDFICGNYYIQIGFSTEKSYYSIKQQQQRKIYSCLQLN